jgi:hypothetical protein
MTRKRQARFASRIIAVLLVFLFDVGQASVAHADVVDEHFVRGNEAAQAGDWEQAVRAYEQSLAVLPDRSAALSYNLGTAYAHLGELGRATFHLERALDYRGSPSAELAEAVRHNLAVVRQRVELQATSSGALVDRPQTWWDLVVEGMGAPGFGWVSLACAWLFLLLFVLRRGLWGRQRRSQGIVQVALLVLGLLAAATGLLHGAAVRADRVAPRAVVLASQVDARDAPGSHGKVVFAVQGGAKGRIVERTPGWARLRLPGGIEGWVPDDRVVELEKFRSVAPTT